MDHLRSFVCDVWYVCCYVFVVWICGCLNVSTMISRSKDCDFSIRKSVKEVIALCAGVRTLSDVNADGDLRLPVRYRQSPYQNATHNMWQLRTFSEDGQPFANAEISRAMNWIWTKLTSMPALSQSLCQMHFDRLQSFHIVLMLWCKQQSAQLLACQLGLLIATWMWTTPTHARGFYSRRWILWLHLSKEDRWSKTGCQGFNCSWHWASLSHDDQNGSAPDLSGSPGAGEAKLADVSHFPFLTGTELGLHPLTSCNSHLGLSSEHFRFALDEARIHSPRSKVG